MALLFMVTGFGSGAAIIPMMALVSHWFTSAHRGKAAGLIVSGAGVVRWSFGTARCSGRVPAARLGAFWNVTGNRRRVTSSFS